MMHSLHDVAHKPSPCCTALQVVPAGSKSRLGFIARQMDVDILVTGGTHEFKVSMVVWHAASAELWAVYCKVCTAPASYKL